MADDTTASTWWSRSTAESGRSQRNGAGNRRGLPPARPPRTPGGSSVSSTDSSNDKEDNSRFSFRNALGDVPVPPALLEGVQVLRVLVDGSMRKSFLTLSDDKFTLYVTSSKVKLKSKGGSTGIGSGLLRRQRGGGAGSNSQDSEEFVERSIDVSAIDRIQRGQVTHKFELAK